MTRMLPPLTVADLACRWQCSAQHIRDLIQKRELSCFRAGRLIRIPAAEVVRFETGTTGCAAASDWDTAFDGIKVAARS